MHAGSGHSSHSSLHPTGRDGITVACYYFGNYHPGDRRNDAFKGRSWTEWELVKAAKPRFIGHDQPKVPLWGYEDESDPAVMERKITAAADHGIDAFIFDWYFYNDGPFLQRPLENGFLPAENNDRLRFALMWANHDWVDIHPYTRGAPAGLLFPGAVTPATWAGCDPEPPAGVSLQPLLARNEIKERSPIHFMLSKDRALRDGDWKLVSYQSEPWELYNIAADRTELHDLAAQYPEIVSRMAAQWTATSRDVLRVPPSGY
jgi:hypothetical protein